MQIQNQFPSYKPIEIRTGLDRYGFSSVLANKCKLRYVPRSFANWVHGWIWYKNPTAEELMTANLPKKLTIVVRNNAESQALTDYGYRDVRIGGLPFAYVPQQQSTRKKNSLLVFPIHSDESSYIRSNTKEYLDYLETLKKDFESIYISVYFIDINGFFHNEALKRGFYVIQGARPDDANSMLRMRAILDSFEYVTTNNMGSHFLYALYSGCKVSFSGPMCQPEKSYFSSIASRNNYRDDYVDRAHWFSGEAYLRSEFKKFFVESPQCGVMDIEYAVDEIGEKFMLQPHEIKNALGWTMMGQIDGYANGIGRRITRVLKNSYYEGRV
jgi:hypothetical protein